MRADFLISHIIIVTCWRTENPDGSETVNIEYGLIATALQLHDVIVQVPLEYAPPVSCQCHESH